MQETNSPRAKTPEYAFDVPKLEASAAEATAAMREFAEKGITQAKDAYARMKTLAEEATGILETTFANASKGFADYGLAIVEMARVNSNANFDFAAELIGARTFAQVIEVSTSHTRKQIERATGQVKDLTSLTQKIANSTAEPIKGGITSMAKKAA